MNLFDAYGQGLTLDAFLARFANDNQKQRWQRSREVMALTPPQRELLQSFRRPMPVLCLAGAWCGDCINQCPIFELFAATAPVIQMRYIDRDEHAAVQKELQINGGNRVPVVVFFSEDGSEVARYGERTLAKYRQLMAELAGASCPTGIVLPGDPLTAEVVADWLREFERVQYILRLSPRLRQKHGD